MANLGRAQEPAPRATSRTETAEMLRAYTGEIRRQAALLAHEEASPMSAMSRRKKA